MNAAWQSWIGMALALLMIAAWLVLMWPVFFHEPGASAAGRAAAVGADVAVGRRIYRPARCNAWFAVSGQPQRGRLDRRAGGVALCRIYL